MTSVLLKDRREDSRIEEKSSRGNWMILDDLILAPTSHIAIKNFTHLFEPLPQPHFQNRNMYPASFCEL